MITLYSIVKLLAAEKIGQYGKSSRSSSSIVLVGRIMVVSKPNDQAHRAKSESRSTNLLTAILRPEDITETRRYSELNNEGDGKEVKKEKVKATRVQEKNKNNTRFRSQEKKVKIEGN